MTTESIITLTPKAIIKVEDILAKEKSKTAMLRVVAMPSPGGSIQYMFAIEENPAENDKIFEFENVNCKLFLYRVYVNKWPIMLTM